MEIILQLLPVLSLALGYYKLLKKCYDEKNSIKLILIFLIFLKSFNYLLLINKYVFVKMNGKDRHLGLALHQWIHSMR